MIESQQSPSVQEDEHVRLYIPIPPPSYALTEEEDGEDGQVVEGDKLKNKIVTQPASLLLLFGQSVGRADDHLSQIFDLL